MNSIKSPIIRDSNITVDASEKDANYNASPTKLMHANDTLSKTRPAEKTHPAEKTPVLARNIHEDRWYGDTLPDVENTEVSIPNPELLKHFLHNRLKLPRHKELRFNEIKIGLCFNFTSQDSSTKFEVTSLDAVGEGELNINRTLQHLLTQYSDAEKRNHMRNGKVDMKIIINGHETTIYTNVPCTFIEYLDFVGNKVGSFTAVELDIPNNNNQRLDFMESIVSCDHQST